MISSDLGSLRHEYLTFDMRGELSAIARRSKRGTTLDVQAVYADTLVSNIVAPRHTTLHFNNFQLNNPYVAALNRQIDSARRDLMRVLDLQYYLRSEYFRLNTSIMDAKISLALDATWLSDFLTSQMDPFDLESTIFAPYELHATVWHNTTCINYFGELGPDQTVAVANLPYEILVDDHILLASPAFDVFQSPAQQILEEQLSLWEQVQELFHTLRSWRTITTDLKSHLEATDEGTLIQVPLLFRHTPLVYNIPGLAPADGSSQFYDIEGGSTVPVQVDNYTWFLHAHKDLDDVYDTWDELVGLDLDLGFFIKDRVIPTMREMSMTSSVNAHLLQYIDKGLFASNALIRASAPLPFVASGSLNTNQGLPWFLDYLHLAGCFFFLAIFVAVMWLVITYSIITKNIEARQPSRETRGFSRAQTGDAITAVVPLTWSITMLMHASTHSINFDENTSGTVFTVNIVAYQWGWNYYFPRDIVTVFAQLPKLVGHGALYRSYAIKTYDQLLTMARHNRHQNSAASSYDINKLGKFAAANLTYFFLKPTTLATNFETSLSIFFTPLFSLKDGSPINAGMLVSRMTNSAIDNVSSTPLIEALDDAGSIVSAAIISSSQSAAPATARVPMKRPALINFNSWVLDADNAAVTLPINPTKFTNTVGEVVHWGVTTPTLTESLGRAARGGSTRDRSAIFMTSNRLEHIYKTITRAIAINEVASSGFVTSAATDIQPATTVLFAKKLSHQHPDRFANSIASQPNVFDGGQPGAENVSLNTWLILHTICKLSQHTQQLVKMHNNPTLLNANSRDSDAPRPFVPNDYASKRQFAQSASAMGPLLHGLTSQLYPNIALSTVNSINSSSLSQLLFYTGVDTGFTYFATTPQTVEDSGLSTSSATLELAALENAAFSRLIMNIVPQVAVQGGSYLQPCSLLTNTIGGLPILSTTPTLWSLPLGRTQRGSYPASPLLSTATASFSNPLITETPAECPGLYEIESSINAAISVFTNTSKILNHISGIRPAYTSPHQSMFLAAGYESDFSVYAQPLSSIGYNTTKHLTGQWLLNGHAFHIDAIRTSGKITPCTQDLLAKTVAHDANHREHTITFFTIGQTKLQLTLVMPALIEQLDMLVNSTPDGSGLTTHPVVSSGLLTGRPNRNSALRPSWPSLLGVKLAVPLAGRATFARLDLYTWGALWSEQSLRQSFPLYRLTRGALVRHPSINLSTRQLPSHPTSLLSTRLSRGLAELPTFNIAKNAVSNFYFVPRPSIKPIFGENCDQGTAALDTTRVPQQTTPIIRLPHAGEEFDLSVLAQFWAPEFNTTRRSDHAAKFDVLLPQVINTETLPFMGVPQTTSTSFYTTQINATHAASLGSLNAATSPIQHADTLGSAYLLKTICDILSSANNGVLVVRAPAYSHYDKPDLLLSNSSPLTYTLNFMGALNDTGITQHYAAQVICVLKQFIQSSLTLPPFINESQTLATAAGAISQSATAGLPGSTLHVPVPNFVEKHISEWLNTHIPYPTRYSYDYMPNAVGSMRRLRVTRGICLPSDYPIHIVCGSKDVIHSWAIPGLGIKIDCIPGYNSHRRVLLRWRGTYWGQCMEVCGRYHHWMPILVRVVHRDTFLSWCLIYLRTLHSRTLLDEQTQANTLSVLAFMRTVENYK